MEYSTDKAFESAFFRPSEIAPQLGVTKARVYQLIASGVIPAVRIGGAIRIPRLAWEEWLREKGEQARRSVTRDRETR